ncbi:hypothetical protein GF373_05675, partial [bacterium]|nr:hypothetical protein [bacterium]
MKKFFLSTLILFMSVPFICFSKESFKKIEIDGNCTGAYQVKIADINNDGKPDVAALGEGRDGGIFWYENPSWKKRPISNEATQRHIDMDFYDLDGDGELELAVASSFNLGDSTSGGEIHWYKRGKNLDSPWQAHFIHAEPTAHRLRWADVDGKGKKELIVLPILGVKAKGPAYDQAAVRVLCFSVPDNPQSPWESHVIDRSLHLAHGLTIEKDKTDSILVASLEGITKFVYKNGEYSKIHLCAGNPHEPGRPGCSESAVGQWRDGKQFITAIEPWHGNQVVVYPYAKSMQQKRTVIDTSFH